ncbi:hypothetical protein SAMN04489842_1348 [Natronobacterium texcoconense]|uniref:Uncharacterized protein n=1 Tax=Natronobacterium texcoconense TaxID=1095778 RepID=A0A1H1CBQ3_NATTX|nr:hypothetical protein SAMN04489842_1348 [Natronobacterium texcoconense]
MSCLLGTDYDYNFRSWRWLLSGKLCENHFYFINRGMGDGQSSFENDRSLENHDNC